MKTCKYCGKENSEEASYCESCGQDSLIKPKVVILRQPQPQLEVSELAPAEPDPDVEPGEDCILCPSCLFPNVPDVTWCKKCGVPVSPTASITPLESAQSMGTVYRGAVFGKSSPVILVGIWILFGPGLLLSGILFLSSLLTLNRGIASLAYLIVSLVLGSICFFILSNGTKNYWAKRNEEKLAEQREADDAS